MKYLFKIFTLIFLLFVSCKHNSISIEDELVLKCIGAHGGMDAWNALIVTAYDKGITLFDIDGKVEKEIFQSHYYSKNPSLSGFIEWSDTINRRITYADGIAYKTNGGQQEKAYYYSAEKLLILLIMY